MINPTLMTKMHNGAKTRIYRGPLNSPRPYSDITEVDPYKESFAKSQLWLTHVGFMDHHKTEARIVEQEETRWTKV